MKCINLLSLLVVFSLISCSEKKDVQEAPLSTIKSRYIQNAIQLDSAVLELQRAYTEGKQEAALHLLFFKARDTYKRVEHFVEYYNPGTARSLNGAAIDKVEEEDPTKSIPPEGFQVIEELMFPHIDTARHSELQHQIAMLVSNVHRLRKVAETVELTDSHVFDALQLQIVRIVTMGIVGFDSPVSFHSLEESAVSLEEMQKTIDLYSPGEEQTSFIELHTKFEEVLFFLKHAPNFNEFDRAKFISEYITPLLKSIHIVQSGLKIPPKSDLRAFSSEAVSLFDSASWSVDFFAPNYSRPLTKEKIELGKLLFFDPILSKNTDRACASCHQPEHGFTDGLPTSRTMDGTQGKLRNAPTMLFAGMQNNAFFDQHVMYLEDQATGVITNQIEMHGSLKDVVTKLKSSNEYSDLFQKAFGNNKDSAVTDQNIRIALASFVRSLTPMNTPFDRFMRGETAAISNEAKQGFNLFSGKAKCATCHFMPFFNGTVPPHFTETEAEVLGVPSKPDTANAVIDPDVGKFTLNNAEIEKHAFKTPTVRNIALTAPYMHNGVYKTLEQVIDFYNRGGGAGIGIHLENQTLPPDKLSLTEKEKVALISFLKTLTDTTGTTSRPVRLPEIISAHGKVRQVGGRY